MSMLLSDVSVRGKTRPACVLGLIISHATGCSGSSDIKHVPRQPYRLIRPWPLSLYPSSTFKQTWPLPPSPPCVLLCIFGCRRDGVPLCLSGEAQRGESFAEQPPLQVSAGSLRPEVHSQFSSPASSSRPPAPGTRCTVWCRSRAVLMLFWLGISALCQDSLPGCQSVAEVVEPDFTPCGYQPQPVLINSCLHGSIPLGLTGGALIQPPLQAPLGGRSLKAFP